MSDATESSSVSVSTTPDPYRGLLWTILLAGVAVRLYLLFSTHATEEDFYITLRYAENIAAGHGFAYNIGRHVLGTTTPLYTLLLACFARIGLDPTLCGKLVGIGADMLAALFTYRLGRTVGRPGAGLAAALLLSFAPTNLIWSTKGMEVGIVAAVAVGAWDAWAEKREMLAWFCAALLVLLRIDGVALAAVMLAATIVRDRRMPCRGLVLFAAMCAPWFFFAQLYFGSTVPFSLGAKLTVYGKLIPGHFPQLRPFLSLMLHNPLGLALALGCALFIGMSIWSNKTHVKGNPRSEQLLVAPLIWICIYYSGMALSHVYLFGWYFVPPTPIYYFIAIVGMSLAAERMVRRDAPPNAEIEIKKGWACVMVALALMIATVVPRTVRTLREGQRVEADLRIPIGLWIHDHAKANETLMLEPIGYIGYYSRLTIIDVIGLVSPEALPSYRPEIACPDHDLWQRLRPDWLLLRAGQLNSLTHYEKSLPENQRLESSYQEVKSWNDPASLITNLSSCSTIRGQLATISDQLVHLARPFGAYVFAFTMYPGFHPGLCYSAPLGLRQIRLLMGVG